MINFHLVPKTYIVSIGLDWVVFYVPANTI